MGHDLTRRTSQRRIVERIVWIDLYHLGVWAIIIGSSTGLGFEDVQGGSEQLWLELFGTVRNGLATSLTGLTCHPSLD